MMGQLDEVRASAERRRMAGDPYALSPDRAAEPDLGDECDLDWAAAGAPGRRDPGVEQQPAHPAALADLHQRGGP
jgi:hypothetical protein